MTPPPESKQMFAQGGQLVHMPSLLDTCLCVYIGMNPDNVMHVIKLEEKRHYIVYVYGFVSYDVNIKQEVHWTLIYARDGCLPTADALTLCTNDCPNILRQMH